MCRVTRLLRIFAFFIWTLRELPHMYSYSFGVKYVEPIVSIILSRGYVEESLAQFADT